MTELPNDFLNLLARSPGEIFYFLLVFILLQAGFFVALSTRTRIEYQRGASRYLVATFVSLIAWGVLMLGLIVSALTSQPISLIVPPLERAVQVLIVSMMAWAFLTADHQRGRRFSNLLLLLLVWAVIIGFVLTFLPWTAPGAVRGGFAGSVYSIGWAAALVGVAVVGSVLTLVLIRMVVDAPLKAIFFALAGFGGVFTLTGALQGNLPGDYVGTLRLTFLGAMLLIPAVMYRMVMLSLEQRIRSEASTVQVAQESARAETPAPAVSPDDGRAAPFAVSERETSSVMKALGMMLERPDPDAIPAQIVTSACNTLKGDVGALLTLQDANYADVIYSHNKLLARPIETFSVNLAAQPTLVNAVERRTQRVLLPDRNSDELRDLYSRFDVEQMGPTYFQPLLRGGEVIAVLMLGMPYSGRELSTGEQETLKTIGILGANLMAISNAAKDQRVKAEGRIIQAMVRGVSPDEIPESDIVASWEEMHRQLDAARDQIVQLSRQVTALKIELDDERSKVTTALSDTEEGLSITGRMLAITEDQARLVDERDQLNARLRDAEAKLASATLGGDAGLFQAMIDVLNREKDDLQNQRDALTTQIAELRAASDGTMLPDAVQDMLQRMSEDKARLEVERTELRQRIAEIEGQLSALGVEGGASGLASLISSLYDQQAQLQSRYDALKREADSPGSVEIAKLRSELANVASDREAITKQREMLRAEKDELVRRVEALKEQRTRVMAEAAAYQQELTEAHVQQAQIRVGLQRALEEKAALTSERDMLRAEKVALETERDGLLARVEGDRDRLAQLGQDGVGSLTQMIDELTQRRAELERDLLQAQLEISELRNRLEIAQIRSVSQSASTEPALVDQFAGLVHGFRTSMTPIIDYVDLLLSESAGILGDMQRKFLLRVASNARRLWTMTQGLEWLTALDTGRYTLEKAPVQMIEIIEDAITQAAVPLREKDLIVHLDLDDDVPLISADSEAMREVVGQLITNAYLACDVGGSLSVGVRHQRLRMPRGDANAQQMDALVCAVTDSGVGIAPEDQGAVFARRYRLENPLIPGLGDTGVGLAIAKQLVEGHGGDIWFDTSDHGTTFFFAIPY